MQCIQERQSIFLPMDWILCIVIVPWGYLYPKPFVQSDHVRGQYVRLPHTPESTDIVSNGNLIR